MRNGWKSVLRAVAYCRGLKIVEIGSGSGGDSLKLQKLGAIVMPVDIKPEHIQSAREKGLRLARIGDMRSLPVEDGWADVAFSANSLVMLFTNDEIVTAIREMVRVVRRGGLIVICTNYLKTTKQPCREIAYYLTAKGLQEVIGALGLEIKAVDVIRIPEKPWDFDGKYLVIQATKP